MKIQSYEDIFNKVKQEMILYYLDPPYPKLNQNEQFSTNSQLINFQKIIKKKLADFAEQLDNKGCKVMISNSKVPLIEELYSDWNINEVPVVRYVSCKKEKNKGINGLPIKNY